MNVKFFCNSGMNLLEYQVNEWIELNEGEVINISFCTENSGYSTIQSQIPHLLYNMFVKYPHRHVLVSIRLSF